MKNKLLIVLLPLAIILINFTILLHEDSFYKSQFKDNNEEYTQVKNNLISYLDKKTELEKTYYSKKEISHYRDVQKIINSAYVILYISLILILIMSLNSRPQKNIIKGCILTILIIAILSLFNFSYIFTLFHKLAFANLNWLLPANSASIRLFPSYFFRSFFSIVLIRSFILSIIIIFFCAQSLKSSKTK